MEPRTVCLHFAFFTAPKKTVTIIRGIKEWRVNPLERVSFSNAGSFHTDTETCRWPADTAISRSSDINPPLFCLYKARRRGGRRRRRRAGRVVRPDGRASLWLRLNGHGRAESRPAGH